MRHLAVGRGTITKLEDLRAPMDNILGGLAEQLAELERYKQLYGEIDTNVTALSRSEVERLNNINLDRKAGTALSRSEMSSEAEQRARLY